VKVKTLEQGYSAIAVRLQQLEPLAQQAELDEWNSMTSEQQRDVALREVASLRNHIKSQQTNTSNMLVLNARQQELAKKATAVGLDPATLDFSNEADVWERLGEAKAKKAREEVEGSLGKEVAELKKTMESLRQSGVPSPDIGGVARGGNRVAKAMEDLQAGRITPREYATIQDAG